MSWLFFAVLAYFIFAWVFILDKFILAKDIVPRPVVYATYVGLSSAAWLPFLILFGFNLAPLIEFPQSAFLALLAGAVYVFGLIVFYTAIKKSDVSIAAPLVGVCLAVFSLLFSFLFLGERLNSFQLFAFAVLIGGGFLISFKKNLGFSAPLGLVFASGLLWSAVFVSMKSVYLKMGFLNAYVFFQSGFVLAGLILLVFTAAGELVAAHWRRIDMRIVYVFWLNKVLAGIAFILVNYAMYLGSVGLVQALQGLQYLFLLAITVFLSLKRPALLKEELGGKVLFRKGAAVLLIIFGLFILSLSQRPLKLAPGTAIWGVSFSQPFAEKLGLDWRQMYAAILDDLKVKRLRLAAYWPEIEKSEGIFSFEDLDWQIEEAKKREAKVILAVGRKLPRWPECHEPKWVQNQKSNIKNQNLLNYVETTINRYKDNQTVWAWQVENEPFLPFGECPPLNVELLDKEIALVKSLDNRPVIISESGELSTWVRGAERADILGTTMYRVVWHKNLPFGGYFKYPLPPEFFHLKANLADYLIDLKQIIVVELQAEPWGPKLLYESPFEEQMKSMNFEQFKENIAYAKKVGFPENYLWGVEWWYWLKEKQNRHEFWNYAKELFIENFK